MLAAHAGYDSNASIKEKKHKSRRWYLSQNYCNHIFLFILDQISTERLFVC